MYTTMKRVLILGGNRYNVLCIEAARRNGYYTVVADKNPQAPGLVTADKGLAIDILDVQALFKAVEEIGGVDGIVSMAEVGVVPAAILSEKLGLPTISSPVARIVTSKACMRERWDLLAQNTVCFRVVNTLEEALSAAPLLKFPVMFKPAKSLGGSRGVMKIDDPGDIEKGFTFARDGAFQSEEVVIEEYVSGREFSVEVLIWGDRTSVLCIGEKTKSPLPYRVDTNVAYPAQLTDDQERNIADLCDKAIKAVGLTWGVAHIEFCITQDGKIVLFELGARCGGGHTPLIAKHVSGVNEFVEYCRMACGMKPTQFEPACKRGAMYRFLVFTPGQVISFQFPEEYSEHPDIMDFEISVKKGDHIPLLRTTRDRSGFVVTTGDDYNSALQLADEVCASIHLTYKNGQAESEVS